MTANIKFGSSYQKEEVKRELNLIKLEYEIIKDFVDFEVFSLKKLMNVK